VVYVASIPKSILDECGFGRPCDQRTITYANHSGMLLLDFDLTFAIRGAFSDLFARDIR
jgi:hypothetical protein